MARRSKSRKRRRRKIRSPEAPRSQRKVADPTPGRDPPTTIILNLTAGGGKARRLWDRIRGELESWPDQPAIFETEAEGHATELARVAVDAGSPLVIAAGGDGTAHEVVQGLMEKSGGLSGVAFGHVPLGTGCDLAFGLGLPQRPDGILRKLRPGREMRMDIGIAELATSDGQTVRYFLNAANIGLGPAVAKRVRRSRWMQRVGAPAYLLASLGELMRARPRNVAWRADDGQGSEGPLLNLSVCNGPSFGGGMRPCPEAAFDSGLLHAAMVGPMGFFAALRQMPRLMRGVELDHPAISNFTCRSLELDGAVLDVETDGEVAGGLPARLSVRPEGLLVRMPA